MSMVECFVLSVGYQATHQRRVNKLRPTTRLERASIDDVISKWSD
jgi:hypothetical protein